MVPRQTENFASTRRAFRLAAILLACGWIACGCQGSADNSSPRSTNSPSATNSGETPTLRRESEQGPAHLTLEVTPARPQLADDITLRLTLRVDAGVEVFPPEFADRLGDFRIREVRALTPRYAGRHDTYTYELTLEPTRKGPCRLLPIALAFQDPRHAAADQRNVVESTEVRIDVESPLAEEARTLDRVGLTGPVASRRRLPVAPIVVVALVAVLLAGIAWRWWRRRGPKAVERTLSPRDVALRELRQLAEERLAERDVKLFFVRLTAIVRMFIERTTAVLAAEQTTEEFLRAISDGGVFAVDDQLRLKDFLESADLIKFAAQQPRPEDVEAAFQRARQFVTQRVDSPSDAEQTTQNGPLA